MAGSKRREIARQPWPLKIMASTSPSSGVAGVRPKIERLVYESVMSFALQIEISISRDADVANHARETVVNLTFRTVTKYLLSRTYAANDESGKSRQQNGVAARR